jgi:hypothetical protein
MLAEILTKRRRAAKGTNILRGERARHSLGRTRRGRARTLPASAMVVLRRRGSEREPYPLAA